MTEKQKAKLVLVLILNFEQELKDLFFFSSRRRHTRWNCDWSSDVCSSDLVGRLHGGGEYRRAGQGLRGARKRLDIDRASGGNGALAHGALQRSPLRLAGAQHVERVLWARTQLGGDLAEQAVVPAQQLHRARPGERLDAAYVRGGRCLADDVKRADLGGGVNVGAAAQLARVGAVADLHHPHYLAVLLAEQGHRSELAGLLEGGGDRANGVARGDPSVDGVLDVAQLLGAERAGVAEVKAQLVRSHVGAGLADMAAEALAQGGMQEMGGRMVALGGAPRGVVHTCEHRLVGRERALLEGDLKRLIVTEAIDVRHAPQAGSGGAFDRAGIGDLTAAGGIERGLGELHEHVRAGSTRRARFRAGALRRGWRSRSVRGVDQGGDRPDRSLL